MGSDVEAEAEAEADEAAEEEGLKSEGEPEQELGSLQRGGYGSHNVFCNGYFTLDNDPTTPHCRIKVLPRWAVNEHMGVTNLSKTLQVRRLDDCSEKPVRTYLVLRAWMLWRFQQGNFAEHAHCRKAWLAHEIDCLRKGIISLGVLGGGSGHPDADGLIKTWVPQAMS